MGAAEWPYWDDLLDYIDQGMVIPIVGADLLVAQTEAGPVTVYEYLARTLAKRAGISAEGCSGGEALNRVIYQCIERETRREDVYPKIGQILREMNLPLPEPLLQLAGIRHFNLFITTTIDSMLKLAIDQARFDGRSIAKAINYVPNARQADRDIPASFDKLDIPTVFHLFGQASPNPNYVLTEEDVLERLCDLLREENRPHRLFEALKGSHLLLIGNHFPGWLALFFMRMAKGSRLSWQRDQTEIIADPVAQADSNLVLYLNKISYRSRLFTSGSPVEFVSELSRRYQVRHPVTEAAPAGPAPRPTVAEIGDAPPYHPPAVFISYVDEDKEMATLIHDALDAAGVDVWFDKHRLGLGAKFSFEIQRNIKNCTLFLPVVSHNTQTQPESYFRLEWNMAAERCSRMTESKKFIIPVLIDRMSMGDADVPEAFRKATYKRLSGGVSTEDFAEEIKQLVRDSRRPVARTS
jgi:hypothetical protein